jgi:eukaryotic-like serine/threonine-protein kinase
VGVPTNDDVLSEFNMATDRHLLIGLLALQNGLIQRAQLEAAFQAWNGDRSRSLADHLIVLGHLSVEQRTVIESLADLKLKAQGGDVAVGMTADAERPSTLESLTGIGDPDIGRTLGHLFSGDIRTEAGRDDPDRTAGYPTDGRGQGKPTATGAMGQRFRILRPHAQADLEPSSSPSTPN